MRMKSLAVLAAVVALLAGAPQSYAAPAGPKPAPVIRVVDIQEVMEKSTAVRGIRRELDVYRKKYDDEFAQLEKALKDEERDLVRQQSLIDAAAYREKVQAFQGKFADFQHALKTRQQQLQGAYAAALGQVSQQVQKIWAAVAEAEGATLLLPRGQVLLFHPSYDVTDDVIDRLNKSLPSVKFPDPTAAGKAPGIKKP